MTETPHPDFPVVPESPAALPFLPLIYVAWSDGDLSPDELRAVRERVERASGLDAASRAALAAWLDPASPPRPLALRALLNRLRERAAETPEPDRLSLAGLGASLAGAQASPETMAALEAIEEALGVAGREAVRDLLPGREADRFAAPEPVDVEGLRLLLDGEYRDIREEARRLLSRPEFRPPLGVAKEVRRERTLEWCRRLADAGYGALSYPVEYGGRADMGRFAAVFETLAYRDLGLTIKFGVQFGLFGGTIHLLGTERHHRAYLRRAGTLELPGCFAMTETAHGSNVADLETTAVYDAAVGEFVVHTPRDQARKDYIGNAAAHGRLAVVFAQLLVAGERHGVHALLVPIRDDDGAPLPGVRIEDCGEKLGLNGVDNGRLWFDQVRVPRENLLNRFADVTPEGEYVSPIAGASKRFFTMIGALVAGRVSVAWASLSAMKSGLTIALRYGDRRRQFRAAGEEEIRLLDYLSHQRRLLPELARAYALDFALKALTRRFTSGDEAERRAVEAVAAGLKAYATWANLRALQTCRECCGGQGYLAENRFAALKADTDVFCTFEGDNTVLMQLLAKSLLSDHRRRFEDARPFTLLKYVAARAAEAIGEPSPVAAREVDAETLRSAAFQLGAMRYREQRLLGSLARRLRHRIGRGVDSFYALIECQDHVLAAAEAHVERLVLDSFSAGVEAAPESVRESLDRLRALHGLARLEADRAWFLEAGAMTPAQSRAVREQVNRLCAEIRPQAAALADGFGIPDELLAAPIAT